MAHEVETMAYANEVPWHGLGAQVSDDLTPDEFLTAAGLDWEVEQVPLVAKRDGGEEIEVPERFALVRSTDNRVLSVISKWWNPLQNRDVLGFMKNYVAAGGATLETAGSLRGGRLVWGLARLNHDFEIRPGDVSRGYLLFTSPHEPGKAISIRTTTVRVVCANTLALAENKSDVTYSQNHLTEFNEDAAKERVGEAHEHLLRAEKQAKVLDKLKLSTDDAVRKVLMPVFTPKVLEDEDRAKAVLSGREKLPASITKILESITDAPGAIPDTAWGVLNGVTHYCDHVAGTNAAGRMASSWDGEYGRKKIAVQKKLLELAS